MQQSEPLGIVLAGGTGSRLHPCTLAVNKQLLPVYDKPLIFYPISVLMLNDIRNIVIVCNNENIAQYENILGDGRLFGCQFSYRVQEKPEGLPQAFTLCRDLIGSEGCFLILGDNIFHGSDMVHKVKAPDSQDAKIFTKSVRDPSSFGVVLRDGSGKILDLIEKPRSFVSDEAVLGLYYFPSCVASIADNLKKSSRGEYEITDLIKHYLNKNKLKSASLGRGTAWFDTGTFESLLAASNYVRTLQVDQNHQIANLEEIALKKKWVNKKYIMDRCETMGKSSYYSYLSDLIV
jgi:glucose-1-phosphate thymidylyltransferase